MNNSKPIKWLIKNSKKQHGKMAVLILANAIFSALSIVFAFLIKEIIDSATVYNDMNRLFLYAAGIVGVVILQFVFRVLINGLTEHIKGRLEMDYKTALFNLILRKKHDKITGYHSGELLNRLTSDVTVVSGGVTSIIPTVVAASTRLICAVISLIILDWIFAVAFSVAGILVFLTVTLLRGKLKSLHKSAQATDGKVRSFMQECIENLLAVKVFAVNGKIEKRARELQDVNFKIKMRRKNYSVVGHATYNFIFSAGYLFALIYGGVKILSGVLSYGSLSAILQLVNNVQVPFASLSNVLPQYYSMVASAERIMEIEEIEGESDTALVDRNEVYSKMSAIYASNIDFTYDRDIVLKGASTKINKGDFVAITGVSGVGKSTLMKLMLGVYPLDNGSVYAEVDGEKLNLDCSTRSLFSYVPQGNMLFSGTLKDNVTFIKQDATEQEIENALKISCADEFVKDLPLGLDTVVGENGVGLSEGQIQRIAVARAVLAGAPIILLDEATSALDEATERKVLDNFKKLDGVTLIIVSHKKAALSICNRHLLIEDKLIKEVFPQVNG
ncbi:MAG: ABC transporter ATP-binding protein [Clostridia bacterium]|nr:ABC transporter ATP-binding protein [Clostridia bacterium]